MFILRSYWKSFGGLSPAPAALPMNFIRWGLSSLNVIQFIAPPDFQTLTAVVDFATWPASTKKRRAPVLSDVRRLWGGIYTVSPGEHLNWIFASEGLYSLCVNSYHRTYYLFTSPATLRENGWSTTFSASSKIFSAYSCKSQPFFVALCVNRGIRRNCQTPSKKNYISPTISSRLVCMQVFTCISFTKNTLS